MKGTHWWKKWKKPQERPGNPVKQSEEKASLFNHFIQPPPPRNSSTDAVSKQDSSSSVPIDNDLRRGRSILYSVPLRWLFTENWNWGKEQYPIVMVSRRGQSSMLQVGVTPNTAWRRKQWSSTTNSFNCSKPFSSTDCTYGKEKNEMWMDWRLWYSTKDSFGTSTSLPQWGGQTRLSTDLGIPFGLNDSRQL